MLESLELYNCQIHEKVVIEFDPLLTILSGPTGSGKSCTIRGLKWLVTNRPKGSRILNKKAKLPVAKAVLKIDGKQITRKKGKSNYYELDRQKYKAIGASVPEPIAQLLNINPVSFASQHTLPHWFSLSSGQVSRELNKIVDLSIIDSSLANAKKKVSKSKSTASISQQRLKEAKQKVKDLEWIIELETDLVDVENFAFKVQESESKLEKLSLLLRQISKHNEEKRTIDEQLVDLESLAELAKEATQNLQRIKQLDTFTDNIEETQSQIQKLEAEIQSLEQDLDNRSEGRCPLCGVEK